MDQTTSRPLVLPYNGEDPLPCHLSWFDKCSKFAAVFIDGGYYCEEHGKKIVQLAGDNKSANEAYDQLILEMQT